MKMKKLIAALVMTGMTSVGLAVGPGTANARLSAATEY